MQLRDMILRPPKLLFYGGFGTSKTATALTLGARAVVLDCDGGLRTGLTLKDKFLEDRLQVEVKNCLDDDPSKPIVYSKTKSYVDSIATECRNGTCKYKALIIDSLTALADGVVNGVAVRNSRVGKTFEWAHWGMVENELVDILRTLKSLPIVAILIAHEQIEKAPGTTDSYQSSISCPLNKLPPKIPTYFNEVWYFKSQTIGAGKASYTIKSFSTSNVSAKTQGQLPDNTDVNLGMVELLKLIGYDIDKGDIKNV